MKLELSMPDTLIRLYKSEKLTKTGLAKAVSKEWITPEQYKEITGEEYSE